MAGEHINTEGYVLDRVLSGENHLRFGLFCEQHGLLTCFQRKSKKPGAEAYVDLFDFASVTLERKENGTSFVKEYLPIDRHKAIGKRYQTLLYAAEWASILSRNLQHAEHFPPLYQLCGEVLNAFERAKRSDVVLLKALWRMAREEGYAVKEQFWAGLSKSQREALSQLIQQPADAATLPEDKTKAILEALRRWMRAETDILI